MTQRVKRMIAIFAVLAAAVIGTGVAYASIPGPAGVINGCYKNSNPGQGALIVIDSTASCPSGTTALNWSQAGPQGPAGVSGYVVETCNLNGSGSTSLCSDTTNLSAGQLSGTLSCPTGKTAISASYGPAAPAGNSSASGGATPLSNGTGYQFQFYTFGSPVTSINVYVTCAFTA